MNALKLPQGLEISAPIQDGYSEILSDEALSFAAALHREFNPRRLELIRMRVQREAAFAAGQKPDFLTETAYIRQGDWTVGAIPADLKHRKVEITGPASDRKMVINALNSGASTYMADLEDSMSPIWSNVVDSQINLRDAVNRSIQHTNPAGKSYSLSDHPATLIVRPRGWHLTEKHILVDGQPMAAAILDFALYYFHNAKTLVDRGSGPYFYLPKLESHLEARLWNDIFIKAQNLLGQPVGTIKATVLIETILAAFEMDEILYELKDHIVGLNCGRWDYIFSYIKKLRFDPLVVLPDRKLITMTVPFMRDYALLTIKTCHRRGAYAIGGMAAQIPIRGDDNANRAALDKVREDKMREAKNGHDGTWVAHPALVDVALEAFNSVMSGANQMDVKRDDVSVSAADLLSLPSGEITLEGLRTNISIGIEYLAAWLGGSGAVPLNHLMEDAATAEISRAQIWQWIRHDGGRLASGEKITLALYQALQDEILLQLKSKQPDDEVVCHRYDLAAKIISELTTDDQFLPFLTLRAYDFLG